MNRFVYHYCAHYQESLGAITYIDGIALLEKRITCMDDYNRFKDIVDCPDRSKLTIDSLSLIGREED